MLQMIQAASGGEEHSILLPALPEVIWSAIIIAIFFLVVLKFVYPKYRQLTEERADTIRTGLEMADKAKREIAEADSKAQREIQAAHEEAAQIREDAHANASRIIAKAKERAEQEAERISLNANRQVEANRQAAEISLKTEVGLLASELAEKIVGEQLTDRELSARVVDRFLDQLAVSSEKESVSN